MTESTGNGEVRTIFKVRGGLNVASAAMMITAQFGGVDAYPVIHTGSLSQIKADLYDGKINFVWSEQDLPEFAISLVVADLDDAVRVATELAGDYEVAVKELPCPIAGMKFLQLAEEVWVFSFHLSSKMMEQLNQSAELPAAA